MENVEKARESTATTRDRIVKAARELIDRGGPDAATTRAVAASAGVQAPTIYRLFGDKRGLLDAVVEDGIHSYMTAKANRVAHDDPVEELRRGWDMHIKFGLANPGLFAIISSDPHPRHGSVSLSTGEEVLRQRIRRIARVGRLRLSEERALGLIQSIGMGTIFTLLSCSEDERDNGLVDAARETMILALTNEKAAHEGNSAIGPALALKSRLDEISQLSAGEKHLLAEQLDRIATPADDARMQSND